MKALFIVLNEGDKLDSVATSLRNAGFYSGTVIDGQGMYSNYAKLGSDPLATRSLLMMLSQGRPLNKIIFLIIEDEKLEGAKAAVRKVIGDFTKDHVGIMFALPVSDVEGLTHLD